MSVVQIIGIGIDSSSGEVVTEVNMKGVDKFTLSCLIGELEILKTLIVDYNNDCFPPDYFVTRGPGFNDDDE